jgi:hypothetical protein
MMITMMQQNFNATFATPFAASYYPLLAPFHTAVVPPRHPIFALTVPVAASAASDADIASAYVVVGVTEVRLLLIRCR